MELLVNDVMIVVEEVVGKYYQRTCTMELN